MNRTLAAIIPLLVLCACTKKADDTAKAAGPRPAVPVVVARVQHRTVPVEVRAIGNVEPYSTIQVRAEVGGQLQQVHFGEGDTIAKGQLLFEIDARPQQETIRQLEANLARDSANFRNAQADAARYGELFKQGIIARQQLEQVQTSAAALEATLAADQAAIATAQLQLQYTRIYSPIDGKTGNLMIKQGNLVKANDVPLVTINQIRPIYVTFAVPERELPEIRRRFNSGLTTIAVLPDESAAAGKLTFIDNSVDQTTGTIKLKGTFPNEDNRLWPGQFVSVILTLAQQHNTVVVPSQAVQAGQKGQYVYIVTAGNKAEFRAVEVGRAAGTDLAIRSGLTPGETVIIDGQSRVTPGAAVQIVKPGAAGSGQ